MVASIQFKQYPQQIGFVFLAVNTYSPPKEQLPNVGLPTEAYGNIIFAAVLSSWRALMKDAHVPDCNSKDRHPTRGLMENLVKVELSKVKSVE